MKAKNPTQRRMFMNNFKKIAAIAAVALIAGTAVLPAYTPVYAQGSIVMAETENQQAVTDAVKIVRSRINIPDEYEDFKSNVSKSQGVNVVRMTWTNPKTSQMCSATVTGKLITSFDKEESEDDYAPSLCKFSKDELAKKAYNWVITANPTMKDKLKATDVEVNIQGSVRVQFKRVEGDIEVKNNSVSVTMSKKTGDVTGFYASWWRNAQFTPAKGILTQEQMKKIYSQQIKLTAHYRISEDEQGGKTARAVYVPEKSYTYNAFDGKETTMFDDRRKASNTDLYDSDDVYAGEAIEEECEEEAAYGTYTNTAKAYQLTDSEKKAVKKLENALTQDQFQKILMNDPFIDYDNSFLVQTFDISENDKYDSGFCIGFYAYVNNKKDYKSISVYADAESGKLSYFSITGITDTKKALDVNSANKVANDAFKYYYPDIFSEYKADEDNTAPAVKTDKYTEYQRTFVFKRYKDGIVVDGQDVRITVNSDNKVTGISSNYTKNVKFASSKILTPEKALANFLSENDMDLYYDGFTDLETKPHTYLHYSLNSWFADALTGKKCDYSGNEIVEKGKDDSCSYTDIAASPYKDEIITLYEHGITFFEGSKLEPTKAITVEEFGRLGFYIGMYGYDSALQKEFEKKMDKPLTRLDMAKIFVSAAGFGEASRLKGIYRQIYTDIPESSDNAGTAAIAYSLGIADPVNGKFNADSSITREEAFHILYKYLSANS